jgi:hypothetical protein
MPTAVAFAAQVAGRLMATARDAATEQMSPGIWFTIATRAPLRAASDTVL